MIATWNPATQLLSMLVPPGRALRVVSLFSGPLTPKQVTETSPAGVLRWSSTYGSIHVGNWHPAGQRVELAADIRMARVQPTLAGTHPIFEDWTWMQGHDKLQIIIELQ
jgi:hypothetical protein